jgi:benzylsuccinate CoA-transferase BbsF subunit
MRKGALEGLNVVGFTTDGVGPLTTKFLATEGATVVVIESQKRPDGMRLRTPFKDNKPGMNRGYRFAVINSDKYDMCLDLKHPRASEVTEKLMKWADVVIDNFRPGVLESWNLSYEEVASIRPDIIMVRLSAQGQTGPNRMAAAYGPHLAGYNGFVTLTGWPDRGPVSIGAYTDIIAPRFGVIAVLAALDYRRRTGKGQHIDISQFEASMQFLTPAILDYEVNNRLQSRDGNKSPCAAPHGAYRCKGEDKWCAIEVFSDAEWQIFCRVIDMPWTQHTKFSTFDGRKEYEDELNKLVENWTIQHSAEEVMMMMQQVGVASGVVRNMGDVVTEYSQLGDRHFWWEIEHPELEKITVFGTSYKLSATPYSVQRPAPCLGEHTQYICTNFLGMSDEEFINLYADGVFN